jgi:hypothetical protein
MSSKHRALRAIAPFALLFLAACSPQAQTASTAQEFMDTKLPGILGAIKNALGMSTGNPETDAALGAAAVIQQMEASDKFQQEALVAAFRGDSRTAEENITAALNGRPNQFIDITALRVALQCGEETSSERRATIESRVSFFKDRSKAVSYLQLAIDETKNAMLALERMDVTESERKSRQAAAANAAALLYTRRASLYNSEEAYKKDSDLARAATYRQMQQELLAGGGGN